MVSRLFPLGIAAALVVLAGCRDDSVTSYRVPKEKDPVMPMAAAGDAGGSPASGEADAGSGVVEPGMAGMDSGAGTLSMAGTAVPTASGPSLVWKAPSNWKVKPPAPMRKASYGVPGAGGSEADLSITAFPGDVGGELANVNRWRGQVQLPPLTPEELAGSVTHLEANGLSLTVVDAAPPPGGGGGQRILGAIVPVAGSTWFFKLMGPDAAVAGAKPAFLDFLKTLELPGNHD